MPSSTVGVVMLAIASLNVLVSIGSTIYSNVGMSSWPSEFDTRVKSCNDEILATTDAALQVILQTIPPLACRAADQPCAQRMCVPGEFCRINDDPASNAKAGECDRCTESKRQGQEHPGAKIMFDFKGESFGGPPVNTDQRCQPFVRDYDAGGGNPTTHQAIDQSYQKHGGVYMCKQSDECDSNGCEQLADNLFGEALRQNDLACPLYNPFESSGAGLNELANDVGPNKKAVVSMCTVPATVSNVTTILASLVIAVGGVMILIQSDLAALLGKVALGASAVGLVFNIGCAIAVIIGGRQLTTDQGVKGILERSTETIPLSPGQPRPGAMELGDLQGNCPQSCRQVKAALGEYFASFPGFANVLMGLVIAQLALSLINVIVIVCGVFCAGKDEGEQQYKIPSAAKNKKNFVPAVTHMPSVRNNDSRRKSMAARAVPFAPGGGGDSGPKEEGEVLVAIYDFAGDNSLELTFSEGDSIELIEEFSDGWAKGRVIGGGKEGLFPLNYTMGKGGRV